MSTLPALPTSQTFESAENLLAQRLQHACAVKPNARLNVSQSISGEWTLSASPELDASTLEAALVEAADLDIFHVPADADEIDEALVKLKSATSRPVWMDNTDAINWEETLAEAMASYPIDVVRAACVAWRQVPQHGKWWPTEQDLRTQCEALFKPRKTLFHKARTLLLELRDREHERRLASNPSPFADGKHRQFRAEMEKRLSADRFQAYFNSTQIIYAGDEIHVRTQVADVVLNREGRDLLKRFGLVLTYRPEEFINVRLVYREETEKERVEVGQAMRSLGEQLKGKPRGAH